MKSSAAPEHRTLHEGIAKAYYDLGRLLDAAMSSSQANPFKDDTQAGPVDTPVVNQTSPLALTIWSKEGSNAATMPQHVFPPNVRPPCVDFIPPEPDTRLNYTRQPTCCLGLLRASPEAEEILDVTARNWLRVTKNEQDERDRLKALVTDVIRAFKRDEFKNANAVTEVVYLEPILESDDFRYLLKEFYSGIDQSGLLDIHQLEGLAQLIQGADPGYIDSDDLVKILGLLSTRLRDTHHQSTTHLYQLTMAVSRVLDAMADTEVKGLDPLMCVPDNETLWQAALRRTGKVVKGVSGLVSAVKGLDLNGFIDGLKDIQQGLGASEVVQLVKTAYEGAASLAESGQGFLECMKEGFSFDRKCAWYSALRGADTLIQEGQLADFRKLVCVAPCRRDPAFQWGVCQRLGAIAVDPMWDMETRQGAAEFLGEMYRNDDEWGDQANIKQWILNILIQLSSGAEGDKLFVDNLLERLQKEEDVKKNALYRLYRENGQCAYLFKVVHPALGSPSLLDRVQERPDVEGNLRQLRRRLLKERGNAVYIPPQAKANLQARDDARFPLMEKVEEFLSGDPACYLWQEYKKGGTIPLHINLSAIDKPEDDTITKKLRGINFTEPQVSESKQSREFILICDGYNKNQFAGNLYTSNRLNKPGGWKAKMAISCRSENFGVYYRDRFKPGDGNLRSGASWFQEAIIAPFSVHQVRDYIDQYVKGLEYDPKLERTRPNPFLMSLSLEVLPRMVDPRTNFSAIQITRVTLYDLFIEQLLDRGKK
ncbi:MAG: hypothetical protein J3Q66DRAFT_364804 [Benniella sp.]|nr:MAG: hypothetical protein J3Q66DRAFT_364804 [Benniella sp.]